MTQHDFGCSHIGEHSDAAKRVSEAYHLHYSAGALYGGQVAGKWIAVALQDGRSDNTLYDNKSDAVTHQHHNENYYAYIQIQPHSMSPCASESFLKWQRGIYDAQMKLADRDSKSGGYDIIPRLTREDQARQNWNITHGLDKYIAIGHTE